MSLNDLIQSEAKKMGVSSKNASKALKKLKKGKVDMSSIAPQIKNMFMANNPLAKLANGSTSLRDRLRAKISSKREGRQSNQTKKNNHDGVRERMKRKEEERKIVKEKQIKSKRNRKKRHNSKLKQLEKKMGDVKIEVYTSALKKLKADSSEGKAKCQLIVDLYHKQQIFSTTMEQNNDLDDLSDLNNLSDLSDLSDIDDTD